MHYLATSATPAFDVNLRLDGVLAQERQITRLTTHSNSNRLEYVVTIAGGEAISIQIHIDELEYIVVMDVKVEDIYRLSIQHDASATSTPQTYNETFDMFWQRHNSKLHASVMKTQDLDASQSARSAVRGTHSTALIEVECFFSRSVDPSPAAAIRRGFSFQDDAHHRPARPISRGPLPWIIEQVRRATHRVVFEPHHQVSSAERRLATISRTGIRPGVEPVVTLAFYLRVASGLPDRSVQDEVNGPAQASSSAPPAGFTALNTAGEPSSSTTISNNNPSGSQTAAGSSAGPSLPPATSTPLLPSTSSATTTTNPNQQQSRKRTFNDTIEALGSPSEQLTQGPPKARRIDAS